MMKPSDMPALIRLVGGPRDGKQFHWECYPKEWHVKQGVYARSQDPPDPTRATRYVWVEEAK